MHPQISPNLLFDDNFSSLFRKWIYQETLKDNILFQRKKLKEYAEYCVINPTDFCNLNCPHCLYSSSNNNEHNKISNIDTVTIIGFLVKAKTKHIVFSGGGEPFENFIFIDKIISNLDQLSEAVIITSAYFAEDNTLVKKYFNRLEQICVQVRKNKGLSLVKIIIRISRDDFYSKQVSQNAINNIVSLKRKNKEKYNFLRIILRTTVGNEKELNVLKEKLTLRLLPSDFAPIIDGIPTKWLNNNEGFEIPILFKPMYKEGRGQKIANKKMYSLWKIVEDEEKSSGMFNLCIRGANGEGHNCYNLPLLGYNNWHKLGRPQEFNSKFPSKDKGLALYITANSDICINNGVPDNYINTRNNISWENFINIQYNDILQYYMIKNGPIYLFKIIQEVEPKIKLEIEATNFVFAISYLSLLTSKRRLYITLRLIEKVMF